MRRWPSYLWPLCLEAQASQGQHLVLWQQRKMRKVCCKQSWMHQKAGKARPNGCIESLWQYLALVRFAQLRTVFKCQEVLVLAYHGGAATHSTNQSG